MFMILAVLYVIRAVERVYTCIDNLEFLLQNSEDRELTDSEKEYSKTLDDCKTKFIAAMDDDLNTADAIAAIFDIVYASNTALSNENKNAKVVVEKTLDLIHEAWRCTRFIPKDTGKVDRRRG